VKVVITDQGIADLRGKSPNQRAEAIIDNCVHPDYKQILRDYLQLCGKKQHTPHTLASAYNMHAEFLKSKDMRNTTWEMCKK
jgi:acyl-CoA hydrolase